MPISTNTAASQPRAATYRTDIDGLRALAVLPVVAYHAGIHSIRGGFIGVDVFFVISGFLITELLIKEIQADRFSILKFYERRIRRILPALICVLLVTYFFSLTYFLPREMVDFSKSLIAAALSASNVYFYSTAGYFDGPALSKPLLHTWSLAVEEQFYIFWPLFLMIGHRWFKRSLLVPTLVISLASLIVSIVGALQFPNATFYLPFSRMWELAAGGLLSMGALPMALGTRTRNALSATGLVLIVGAVLLIAPDMPFPGLLAIPPVAGAVMIILAGRDGSSIVGRLLSLKPIVFIGLISYSLYLWHWPISVFQKNYALLSSGTSEMISKLIIIFVSLLCATVSWRVIEQPFRSGKLRPANPLLMKMAAAGIAAVVIAGAVGWERGGFPARFTDQEIRYASYLDYNPKPAFRAGTCFLLGGDAPWQFAPECLAVSSIKKNYLLLGDSHAAQLWYGLSTTFQDKNFLQAAASDCFPTIVHSLSESPKCTAVIDGIFQDFLLHHPVDRVFLIARWKPGLLDNVAATLDWLEQHHIPVTLVGPSALFDSPVPRLLVTASRNTDPALMRRHLDGSMRTLDATMAELAKTHRVDYLSLVDRYCSDTSCVLIDPSGMPMVFDQEHITAETSVYLAKELQDAKLVW